MTNTQEDDGAPLPNPFVNYLTEEQLAAPPYGDPFYCPVDEEDGMPSRNLRQKEKDNSMDPGDTPPVSPTGDPDSPGDTFWDPPDPDPPKDEMTL